MFGLGFRVYGLGFRVYGLGFRVYGLGFRVNVVVVKLRAWEYKGYMHVQYLKGAALLFLHKIPVLHGAGVVKERNGKCNSMSVHVEQTKHMQTQPLSCCARYCCTVHDN